MRTVVTRRQDRAHWLLRADLLAVCVVAVAATVLLGATSPPLRWVTTWGAGAAAIPWMVLGLGTIGVASLAPRPQRPWLASLAAVLALVALARPGLVGDVQSWLLPAATDRPSAGVGVALLLLAVATAVLALDRLVGLSTALAAGAAAVANLSAIGRLTNDGWLVRTGDPPGPGAMSLPTIVLILMLTALILVRDHSRPRPMLAGAHSRRPVMGAVAAAVILPTVFAIMLDPALRRGPVTYALTALFVVAAAMVIQLASVAMHHHDALSTIATVVESSPESTLLVNGAGTVLGANAAAGAMFGIEPAALTGTPGEALLGSLLHPRPARTTSGRASSPAVPEPRSPQQALGQRSDGTSFPCEVRIAPVRLHGAHGAVVTVRDVTRQQEELDRLRHLRRMQDLFMMAVSHELRTPVTVVSGIADTLEEHADRIPEERRRDLTRRLAAQARHLQQLTRELLDMDRLRRGVATDSAPVDAGTVVSTLADHWQPNATLTLDVRVTCPLPPVTVDTALLERAVDKLLLNAAKYAPGAVEVTVAPAGDGVLITVDDHGPGVPPALRGQVFRSFERGEELDVATPGLGVGLTFVTEVAASVGGRAWVQDRTDGATGASFRLWLPTSDMPAVSG